MDNLNILVIYIWLHAYFYQGHIHRINVYICISDQQIFYTVNRTLNDAFEVSSKFIHCLVNPHDAAIIVDVRGYWGVWEWYRFSIGSATTDIC